MERRSGVAAHARDGHTGVSWAAVSARPGTIGEVARYFLRLGCIAFGGPAAHVALMRRELVQQRRWVTDEEFMDLLGAANLIPGPNSTEMAMHLGYARAGWRGLWVGGLGFILPAVAVVLAIAWAYVRWGHTPAGEALAAGIQPLILAVVVQAIWGLRKAAVKGARTLLAAAGAAGAVFHGVNEVFALLGAGLALALLAASRGRGHWRRAPGAAANLPGLLLARLPPGWSGGATALPAVTSAEAFSRLELFLVFLKIGAVLYGSGYVLVSFLQADLVDARGWLTQQELVDAVAVGQFTPGPLFSSATFAGYVIDGWIGAALATLGIFLPSFVFVALTHPFVPRLRRLPWTAAFLDGVNAAALALMALVTLTLTREALDGWFGLSLFLLGAAWLMRWNPSTALVVGTGAVAGLLRWGSGW